MSVEMKQLPILLIICVSYVYSKTFLITLERLEQCSKSRNPFLEFPDFSLGHRRGKAVNVTNGEVILNEDIGKDVRVQLHIYKKVFFTWLPIMPFPSQNVCKFIKHDEFFWPTLQKLIPLPKTCPIPQGKYVLPVHETLVDNLPSLIPNGCVRIDATITGQSGTGCVRLYATVNNPNLRNVNVCKV